MATKRLRRAVKEIRDLKERECFHELTFAFMEGIELSDEQKTKLEARTRKQFCLWWDSWIEPQLKIIEKG